MATVAVLSAKEVAVPTPECSITKSNTHGNLGIMTSELRLATAPINITISSTKKSNISQHSKNEVSAQKTEGQPSIIKSQQDNSNIPESIIGKNFIEKSSPQRGAQEKVGLVEKKECTVTSSDMLETLSNEYDLVLAQTLPFSIEYAFETLWKSENFTNKLLTISGETQINIGPWVASSSLTYTAFNKLETFDASRQVQFTHHKKYMIGPSEIPTLQVYRYKYDRQRQILHIGVTSTVSDAPYHDYFRAESSWVFCPAEKEGHCKLQTGMRLCWLKSTWLKSQV